MACRPFYLLPSRAALTRAEEKREIILAFQKSMREVAMKLSQFGQDRADASASRAPGGRGSSRTNIN